MYVGTGRDCWDRQDNGVGATGARSKQRSRLRPKFDICLTTSVQTRLFGAILPPKPQVRIRRRTPFLGASHLREMTLYQVGKVWATTKRKP